MRREEMPLLPPGVALELVADDGTAETLYEAGAKLRKVDPPPDDGRAVRVVLLDYAGWHGGWRLARWLYERESRAVEVVPAWEVNGHGG